MTNIDISQIELNKLSVLDAPDFYKWASPNELPMSSGYMYYKNNVDMKKAFSLYKRNNVIGIGIKVDRYLDKIPKEVIDYANKIDFPIIYIPNEYSFSDIFIPVMNSLMDEKLTEYQTSYEIVSHLINLGLQRQNEQDVINYLYEIIKVDLVFFNDLLQEKTLKSVSGEDFTQFKREENTYTYDLNNLGKIVLNTKEINMSLIQHKTVEYAAKVILIIYKEKLSMQKVEEDYKKDLVSDICHGNINTAEELKLRSNLYGWDIADEVFVAIFDIDHYKAKTVELGMKSRELEQTRTKMYNFIMRKLENQGITYYTYNISDRYIFIFEEEDFINEEQKQTILKDIKEQLYKKFNFTFTIAQGSIIQNLLNTKESYQQALDTVKISRILYGDHQVVKYEDVEPYTLLADVSQTISSRHSILDPIMKILDYDSNHSNEYFKTLENLVKADWNITRLSKQEYIHYNTAKYRLEKIEEITGLDLRNGNNKFNLELSYKLYQIKIGISS